MSVFDSGASNSIPAIIQPAAADLFAIGQTVPISGLYVCVPCGYTQQFEAGELFTTCDACLAGTDYGPEGYTEPEAEFWTFMG